MTIAWSVTNKTLTIFADDAGKGLIEKTLGLDQSFQLQFVKRGGEFYLLLTIPEVEGQPTRRLFKHNGSFPWACSFITEHLPFVSRLPTFGMQSVEPITESLAVYLPLPEKMLPPRNINRRKWSQTQADEPTPVPAFENFQLVANGQPCCEAHSSNLPALVDGRQKMLTELCEMAQFLNSELRALNQLELAFSEEDGKRYDFFLKIDGQLGIQSTPLVVPTEVVF